MGPIEPEEMLHVVAWREVARAKVEVGLEEEAPLKGAELTHEKA